jgi:hypothetical protein
LFAKLGRICTIWHVYPLNNISSAKNLIQSILLVVFFHLLSAHPNLQIFFVRWNVELQNNLALDLQTEAEPKLALEIDFNFNKWINNKLWTMEESVCTENRSSNEIPKRLGGSGSNRVELKPIFSSIS